MTDRRFPWISVGTDVWWVLGHCTPPGSRQSQSRSPSMDLSWSDSKDEPVLLTSEPPDRLTDTKIPDSTGFRCETTVDRKGVGIGGE